MRHGNKVNHLGRKTGHLKAMLSNMACSLLEHKRITTTLAKAKSLRVFVEPILTKSKNDTTHSRRLVFSHLQNKEVVTELFRDIALKIATRNGGYTRIIRTGFRLGDNAEMCIIELVDYNDIYTNEKAKKTTRRSRRGGGGITPSVSGETDVEDVVSDEVVAEDTVVQDAIVEDVVSEEVVVEETVAEDTVVQDAIVEDVVSEEVVVEEVVAEEVVAEEAVVEETVVAEVVAEEAVVEETTPETPAEDSTEEAVVEDTVTEEVVVGETVSEESVIEEITPETPAE
ncbi:MAG: 50S ribosomal protein L17, partial [Flavobacteriia bacterium]|nr:50S ribosomal protein L17 [Flavobacteriia bacterium]